MDVLLELIFLDLFAKLKIEISKVLMTLSIRAVHYLQFVDVFAHKNLNVKVNVFVELKANL